MKIYPIYANTVAFKANKKKNDSEKEEIAAIGGGAVGGKAAYELSKINKVATATGNKAKTIFSKVSNIPQEAKSYTASIERFLKNIHLDKIFRTKSKFAGGTLGVIGGVFSLGAAAGGITEAVGAYSGLIVNDKK